MPSDLLSVEGLSVTFAAPAGRLPVLDGVSFTVAPGEMLGLAGESGSGKSVTALAILRLLDRAARIEAGQVRYRGVDVGGLSARGLTELRGREIAMIFQNPRGALNPVLTIGAQLVDRIAWHGPVSRAVARDRAVQLLRAVALPDAERRMAAYPHELSGGQCQRAMVALALAGKPSLLIADEPTSGLDTTTQVMLVRLLKDLAAAERLAVLFITHDLSLAADLCDRIAVMHAGHVVEIAPARALFDAPRHPYTARLLAAMPRLHAQASGLQPIPGGLPDLRGVLPPCRFAARCERHAAACDAAPLPRIRDGARMVACAHPLAA